MKKTQAMLEWEACRGLKVEDAWEEWEDHLNDEQERRMAEYSHEMSEKLSARLAPLFAAQSGPATALLENCTTHSIRRLPDGQFAASVYLYEGEWGIERYDTLEDACRYLCDAGGWSLLGLCDLNTAELDVFPAG